MRTWLDVAESLIRYLSRRLKFASIDIDWLKENASEIS